jgi:DNA repair protein RadD
MQEKFDTKNNNDEIVSEIAKRADDRKHWLVFCSGVEHAEHISESFNAAGIAADFVTGKDSPTARDEKIRRFEAGEIRVLCNVGILTTGYNFKPLDCIVLLRETTSPGLYLQIVVRGMRISPGKEDCLVLDFCNNVRTHGPVTNINPPPAPGKRKSTTEKPMKACPECYELLFISVMQCNCCGYQFPKTEKKYKVNDDLCIMGKNEDTPVRVSMNVTSWSWAVHTSKKTGKDMLKVTYRGSMIDPKIEEYIFSHHEGVAEIKSRQKLQDIVARAGGDLSVLNRFLCEDIEELARYLKVWIKKPEVIEYERNGRFFDVKNRRWSETKD